MGIEKLFKIFKKQLNDTDLYNEKNIEIFNRKETLIRFSSEGMGATISLKLLPMSSDYQTEGPSYTTRYKVEIKGQNDYKAFKKNCSFLINIITEKLQEEQVRFNKFYTKIKKENLAYNMLNENFLLLDKSSEIIQSITEIQKSNSLIAINKFDGVSISSRSKGGFSLALEMLEDILVS